MERSDINPLEEIKVVEYIKEDVIENNEQEIQPTYPSMGKIEVKYPRVSSNIGNYEEEKSDSRIKISIVEHTIKSELLLKGVYFIVKGQDSSGTFESSRKFKDFRLLREHLSNSWPGCYIPPVPHKKNLGTTQPEFIEHRKKLLNWFLAKISSMSYLYESPEFQEFIRGNSEYRKVEWKKSSYDEISQKCQKIFKEFSSGEYNENHEAIIEEANNYFKSGKNILERFEQICKANTDYFYYFGASFSQLFSGFVEVGGFYTEAYGSHPLHIHVKEKPANPFTMLLDWVRWEIIDLEAIMEAISRVKDLEKTKIKSQGKLQSELVQYQKLQAGRKSISQILSIKSKEQNLKNLQGSTINLEAEIDALSVLQKICTSRFVSVDLPAFKKQKSKKYELILRSFTKSSVSEFQQIILQTKEIEDNLNS
ncbi:unnamed protein product [Blepharisma stoltei]|uniref:PX domain-containing protein n=1 Tax=Blepharisma stoltei TaxID=1481888 RepID=A0AAU9JEM4_9CILI|nr:unnamed protein product [Blepharisma stoltei]